MPMDFWETFKPLYTVDTLQGYTEEDMAVLREMFGTLPQVLEDYYCAAGRTEAFHHVQDMWVLPEHFRKWKWLQESEYMIILNENQGACRAAIRRDDLNLPDPPVYTTQDDQHWDLCTPTTREFLSATLAYEGIFTFSYYPEEIYWITEQERELIESKLTKFPFEMANWNGIKIALYNNEPDNMVAILGFGESDLQILYGAATEASYEKLMTVLRGIGEPV